MKERAAPEYWVLDGLEDTPQGCWARLERADGKMIVLPAPVLPDHTREGDVLQVVAGPDGDVLRPAPEETARRREAAQERLSALNGPTPTGDIDL